MTTTTSHRADDPRLARMLNKVPEVTVFFWIIKVLSTTVGETAADLMNDRLGFGLTGTTVVMGGFLVVVLTVQMRARRYVPAVYWLAVVLVSIVGTLVTDNLTDRFGVPLEVTTVVFAVALAATFAGWYAKERTLSIHSIVTTRREAFYWLAILFTFSLGTAAGDLVSEQLALGYWVAALVFAAVIGLVALAHYRFGLGAITAFWAAYVLTRPLGASVGDLVSQDRSAGGLGLGTVWTSVAFLVAIVALVLYLSVSGVDRVAARTEIRQPATDRAGHRNRPR